MQTFHNAVRVAIYVALLLPSPAGASTSALERLPGADEIGSAPELSLTSMPEPASLLLLSVGLVGAGMYARSRKRRT